MLSFLNSEEKRVLSQGNLKNYHAFVTWPQTPKYITGIRERLKKLTDTEEQLNKFSENKIERVLAEFKTFYRNIRSPFVLWGHAHVPYSLF